MMRSAKWATSRISDPPKPLFVTFQSGNALATSHSRTVELPANTIPPFSGGDSACRFSIAAISFSHFLARSGSYAGCAGAGPVSHARPAIAIRRRMRRLRGLGPAYRAGRPGTMRHMSDDLTRQIRACLAGLETAGVDWLPRVTEPPPAPDPLIISRADPAGPPPDPDSPARRVHELTVLAERVRRCDRCPELVATRTQTVFGVGPVGAEVVFVG